MVWVHDKAAAHAPSRLLSLLLATAIAAAAAVTPARAAGAAPQGATAAESACARALRRGQPAPRADEPATAEAPLTSADYWREVNLPLSQLEAQFEPASCYASEMTFLACVAMIRAVYDFAPDDRWVLPPAGIPSLRDGTEELERVGGALIARVREPEHPNKMELVLFRRHAITERDDAWRALYAGRGATHPIDFEALLERARSEFIDGKNAYLAVPYAINAGIRVQDPHGRLQPRREYFAARRQTQVRFGGVGVVLMPWKGGDRIARVLPGGPADEAGLEQGDLITHVDGVEVAPRGDQTGQLLLMGAEGTATQVRLVRDGVPLEATITRRAIERDNVTAAAYTETFGKIGVIGIGGFESEATARQVREAIGILERAGARALILDLRGNRGGTVDFAVAVADLFLPDGKPTLFERRTDQTRIAYERTHDGYETRLPLVVLVDGQTASSAELLAGMLQDHQRAWIVGERTFGKGVMQEALEVPGYPSLLEWRTTAWLLTHTGHSPQIVGIEPEFKVPLAPHLTQLEQFKIREQDTYENAPAAWPKPYRPARSGQALTLRKCVKHLGRSREAFYGRAETSMPYDYPMLFAADLFRCLEITPGSR